MKKDKEEVKKDPEKEEEEQLDPSPEGGQDREGSHPMVALTYDEYDALEKKIQSLKSELDEKQDQWLRTRADFENYKKRMLRDANRSYQDAMTSVLKIFLSVVDDLERALKNRPEGKVVENWMSGIELIHQKLINQMKNQGIERMNVTAGDDFDPNIHEAITQEENPDFDEGQVIEVVQPGYKISDRIIRPAMVRVAK